MAWSEPHAAIAAAQAVLRRRHAAAWCAAIAAGLAVGALALVALDVAMPLPDGARRAGGWAWLAAAPAALAALALRWRTWAPTERTVRIVEAACGDRERTLAQALDLAAQPGELAHEAARRLAGRLPLDDLPRRLPGGGARIGLGILAAALAVAGLAWLAAPDLLGAGWARWTDPAGDHPPWSPTRLAWAAVPEAVRAGHPARIEVAVAGRPCSAPTLVVEAGDGALAHIAMFPIAADRWAAEIARVGTPLTLWAEGGGTRTTRRGIALDPVPELTWLDLRLDQPAYAGLPPTDRRLQRGGQAQFDALRDATLRLAPHANRPLAAVQVSVDGGAWRRLPLADGAVGVPAATGVWRLRLEAADGAVGGDETVATVTARADQPPSIEFAVPSHDAYATPDAVVPFAVSAGDDLGLASAERFREVGGLGVPTADDQPHGRSWAGRGRWICRRWASSRATPSPWGRWCAIPIRPSPPTGGTASPARWSAGRSG